MSPERRRALRTPIRVVAFVKHLKTGKVRRTLTKDISGGGVCIVGEEHWEPGTAVEMELRLPDRDAPITCRGEVVWRREVGRRSRRSATAPVEIGMKFVVIDPKDQKTLLQYAVLNPPPAPGAP